MQAYGRAFAHVYDRRFTGFARQVGPRIRDYYAGTPMGQRVKSVLDLCCGTGQLALDFLEQGYRVVGLDLSEAMLRHAREHARDYLETGQAAFVTGDAARFSLERPVGLVTSTFDALNHLESFEALTQCFAGVHHALVPEGVFVFDLNTRKGLFERWNQIHVDDTEEGMVVIRGVYDGVGDRAVFRFSGFVRDDDGRYQRFEETVFNTVFDLAAVRRALLDTGMAPVHFARIDDLAAPVEDPEHEGRIFVVSRRLG